MKNAKHGLKTDVVNIDDHFHVVHALLTLGLYSKPSV